MAGTTALTKQSRKHCNGNTVGSTYSSLSAAEAACLTNSQCTGVYDDNCDNRGSFYQCNSAALQTSTSSCVYTKSNGVSRSRCQNLTSLSSPFSGTTAGRGDAFSGCGGTSGNTYKFFVLLQPGSSITIGLTSSDFDSMQSAFWSTTTCPTSHPGGDGSRCTDEPNTQSVTMLNPQSELPRTLWFVVNGYGVDDSGGFTLAWTIDREAQARTAQAGNAETPTTTPTCETGERWQYAILGLASALVAIITMIVAWCLPENSQYLEVFGSIWSAPFLAAIFPALASVVFWCFLAFCAGTGHSKQHAFDVVLVCLGVPAVLWEGVLTCAGVDDKEIRLWAPGLVQFIGAVAMLIVGSVHIHSWP